MSELEAISIQPGHRAALMVLSVLLFALVLELVRRDLLKERYALLWLATAAFGLVIGVFPQLIAHAAYFFHFQMLTALFVFAFLFVLGIIIAYSVLISRLTERNRKLAQELALLANRVEHLEAEHHDS